MGLRNGGRPFTRAFVLAGAMAAASSQLDAEQAVRQVAVTADVHGRTFVRASASTLVMTTRGIGLPTGGAPPHRAVATIHYEAAARTRAGGEVLLVVEHGPVRGPRGTPADDTLVSFDAGGSGPARAGATTVAARWTGSGLRRGTIVCTLRAVNPGTYTVPLQLMVIAP